MSSAPTPSKPPTKVKVVETEVLTFMQTTHGKIIVVAVVAFLAFVLVKVL